jgi:hypothetical protein
VEVQRDTRQSRKVDMLNFAATRVRINCTENVRLIPEEIIEITLQLWQQDWKETLILRRGLLNI